MQFGVLVTAWATPDDLFLPSPVPVQDLAGSSCHVLLPAAARTFVAFSVVPDSSERKKTVMGSPGRLTPEFNVAILSSFQVLIVPLKICDSTSAFSTSLSTPTRL